MNYEEFKDKVVEDVRRELETKTGKAYDVKARTVEKMNENYDATGMSQSKFALYLGIPVANIQHWEQGKTNPPDYVASLISRVMKNYGYIKDELSTAQIDMLRQTNATLLIENLKIGNLGIEAIGEMLKGKISREDYQKMLKYKANGKH